MSPQCRGCAGFLISRFNRPLLKELVWKVLLTVHLNILIPKETYITFVIYQGWGGPDLLTPTSLWIHNSEIKTGPCSAVGNVSGYRCVSDCRSRGREFDPVPVPYCRGDWSWNNFYGHSPPFPWFIQEGLLSVTSESMCTNYWLTACPSLPRKKCG